MKQQGNKKDLWKLVDRGKVFLSNVETFYIKKVP